MGRLLFLILILVLAFALWRYLVARFAAPPARKPLETELVKCASCQSHVPKAMAVHHDQAWYCREHAPDDADNPDHRDGKD